MPSQVVLLYHPLILIAARQAVFRLEELFAGMQIMNS